MKSVNTEDAAEGDDVTNKDKHGGDSVRLNANQKTELAQKPAFLFWFGLGLRESSSDRLEIYVYRQITPFS